MGLLGLGVGVSQTRVWRGCFSGWQASTEVRLLLPGLPLTNGLSPGSCDALGGQCHPFPIARARVPVSCFLIFTFHCGVRVPQWGEPGNSRLWEIGFWGTGCRPMELCPAWPSCPFWAAVKGEKGQRPSECSSWQGQTCCPEPRSSPRWCSEAPSGQARGLSGGPAVLHLHT